MPSERILEKGAKQAQDTPLSHFHEAGGDTSLGAAVAAAVGVGVGAGGAPGPVVTSAEGGTEAVGGNHVADVVTVGEAVGAGPAVGARGGSEQAARTAAGETAMADRRR